MLPSALSESVNGKVLLVASDLTREMYECKDYDLDKLIDLLQDAVGPQGTLLLPVFNWEFCGGRPWSIGQTPGRTGALGEAARGRSDFLRSQHPIYSFMVCGALKHHICGLRNKTAFGWDSPFPLIDKMLLWNIEPQHSFTFVHHVEQALGAPWRYEKSFGDYSMYVRRLEDGVEADLQIVPKMHLLDMAEMFHVIKKSILLCKYGEIYKDKYGPMRAMFDKLWPIMRSITGDGVRETVRILQNTIPLKVTEVPSGTEVFDWTVPQEWVFREAYLEGPDGRRFIDTAENNLHLLNYSEPFDGKMSLRELHEHLFIDTTISPDAIPYRTSYYKRRWGFCLSMNQREQMQPGEWTVHIDTELKDGSMTMAEAYWPGESEEEIWFTTYFCHPSMANNELSGPIALAFLWDKLASNKVSTHYSYRFIYVPETIGALAYMAQAKTQPVAGYEVTCCGRGQLQYKRSRLGGTVADRVGQYLFPIVRDYQPDRGGDERTWCAPGFDLPMGCITRDPPGEYDTYHTSLDNWLDFAALSGTVDTLYRCIEVLEKNITVHNLFPYGEPKMDKRNIGHTMGGPPNSARINAIRWVLAYDGEDLLRISERSGIEIDELYRAVQALREKQLVT